MKRTLLLGLLVLGLVAVVVAAADFSGTWVLNKEKSDQQPGRGGGPAGPPPDQTLVIKQSGNDLSMTRTMNMGGQERTMPEVKYTLDGKEVKSEGRGGPSVAKATVEGDTIVIATTRTTQQGEMTTKEVYALSDGGKVLTITRTMGDRPATKQVFDKK